MAELNLRVSEIAQEQTHLLLSRATSIPIETLEKLNQPLQPDLVIVEDLLHLKTIAETLKVPIYQLLADQESEAVLLTKIFEIARQSNIDLNPETAQSIIRNQMSSDFDVCKFLGWCTSIKE